MTLQYGERKPLVCTQINGCFFVPEGRCRASSAKNLWVNWWLTLPVLY
jgi:hypothetical protein